MSGDNLILPRINRFPKVLSHYMPEVALKT